MTSGETGSMLQGRRILLVEDNYLIALSIQRLLLEWGCEVIGPAPSVHEGMRLAGQPLDGAILDINIVGGTSMPVADLLQKRGCPVVFITGYGSPAGVPDSLAETKRITKPIDERELELAVREEFGGVNH